MKCIHTLLSLLALALVAQASADPRLTVVTEDIPPLNYQENGRIEGISTEIVRAVLLRAGLEADINVYPWARAMSMAENQPGVLIYSIGRLPAREERFKWIGPMFFFTESLYRLKARGDITPRTLDDARHYTIGVVRGYAVHELLKDKGFRDDTNLAPIATQEQNIKRLYARRIDLLVGSRIDLAWRIKRDPTLGNFDGIEEAMPLNETFTELYMAFGQKTDDALVERVRKAFEQVRSEGLIERTLRKYNYPAR